MELVKDARTFQKFGITIKTSKLSEKKSCEECGNDIGTDHIHKNLHILFDKMPWLKSRYNHNVILIEYWKMFNGYGNTTLKPTELEQARSIDREERNILPVTERGLLGEAKIKYHYGYRKGRRGAEIVQ